jgi:hypothetical protein
VVIPILGFFVARAICRRLLRTEAHPLRGWTGTPVGRAPEGGFEPAGKGGAPPPP